MTNEEIMREAREGMMAIDGARKAPSPPLDTVPPETLRRLRLEIRRGVLVPVDAQTGEAIAGVRSCVLHQPDYRSLPVVVIELTAFDLADGQARPPLPAPPPPPRVP